MHQVASCYGNSSSIIMGYAQNDKLPVVVKGKVDIAD